jgi:hypothetical protein
MLAAGFTKRDLRRMTMIAAVHDLGPEVFRVFLEAAIETRCSVARQARTTLKLFGGMDPADRVAVAKAMLEANKSRKRR